MNGLFNWVTSTIWSSLSWAARALARNRVRLDARVIGVGNLQAGGAGKTPLVAKISREAAARGIESCILCRGYGGEWEKIGGVIAPSGPVPPTAICGDEAALLHELAPGAWIGVGADRASLFARVVARAPRKIELAILDDGFQNHRLHKDLDILALTSATRFGRIFRDWPSSASRASLLIWTKGTTPPLEFEKSQGIPRIRIQFQLPRAGEPGPICLITGLADGEAARRSAEEAGYQVGNHVCFPDHARFAVGVMNAIGARARERGQKIAVTGKDWVKLRELPGWKEEAPLVLEPELVLGEEEVRTWNRVLWGT